MRQSRRGRPHLRCSKMFELLFLPGVSVLNRFFVHNIHVCLISWCSHLTAGWHFFKTMSKFILISRFILDLRIILKISFLKSRMNLEIRMNFDMVCNKSHPAVKCEHHDRKRSHRFNHGYCAQKRFRIGAKTFCYIPGRGCHRLLN